MLKLKQPRVSKTCFIPNENHRASIMEEIKQLIQPEEVKIFSLAYKTKNLESLDTPVFVFKNDSKSEALELIIEWVNAIDIVQVQQSFSSPPSMVTWFVCITSKDLFDDWMKNANSAPEGNLRIALGKIKVYEQFNLV